MILPRLTPAMLRWHQGQVPQGDANLRCTEQRYKGHGRIERRRLIALSVDPVALAWPGARQVMLLETIRQPTGRRATCAYHRAVTSLRSEQADADELLDMLRGHWGIEHRLFPIRDVTFGEDACRVRTGQAPRILAMLRNLAVSLLHQARCPNHAAALRRHAAHPDQALALINAPPR